EHQLRAGAVERPEDAEQEAAPAVPPPALAQEALAEAMQRRAGERAAARELAAVSTARPFELEIAPVPLEERPIAAGPEMADRVAAGERNRHLAAVRPTRQPPVDAGRELDEPALREQ